MAVEYVADFETTASRVYDIKTHKLSREFSETWVCAWALIPVEEDPQPDHIIHGRSIDSFMAAVADLYNAIPFHGKSKRKEQLSIFTHNLKFDSDFIIWWLLHGHGEIRDEVRENVLYSFTGIWDGVTVTFRDSLKIFPESAAKLGELYNIPKLKGEWDYNKFRTVETPISPEEWGYIDHDVMIISRALADYRSRGYYENTLASIAYNDRLRRTFPKFKKTWARRLKNKDYERFQAAFPRDIRPLDYELHSHLMMGYYGGISYLNPLHACKDLTGIHSYDVHSMYPDKMAHYRLPVGDPLIIDRPSQEEAWRMIDFYSCVMVDWEDLSLDLKSADNFPALMFPTIPQTSVRMEGKIIKCRGEIAVLTGIDCKIMRSEYNILSGRITRLYLFKTKKGMYKEFVDYWMDIKSGADRVLNDPDSTPQQKHAAKILRTLAKKMLNSSYGKDGTKLLREPHFTYLDPDTDLLESDIKVELAKVEYYLPTAIFICAWARWQLWSAVKLLRRDFVYCDTDSVKVTEAGKKILETSPEFRIDPYELGTWGYEGEYITARFVRQKTYSYTQMGRNGPERHYTVCGAPDDIKAVMDINEFLPGMEISLDKIHACTDSETGKPLQGRLLPVRCRGGVILEETGFKISRIDNWDEYNGRNMPIDYALLKSILY